MLPISWLHALARLDCGPSDADVLLDFSICCATLPTGLPDDAQLCTQPIKAHCKHLQRYPPVSEPAAVNLVFATSLAVTFVAMGNGAPDLSANISAIRNGSWQLSAGAFTGAAMFVQCVVGSEVSTCVMFKTPV